MVEAFCMTCQRTTYVRHGGDLTCPVCSLPLLEIESPSDSEAG
jgi:uncharacterized Zn finger protein (UPF0148 family)